MGGKYFRKTQNSCIQILKSAIWDSRFLLGATIKSYATKNIVAEIGVVAFKKIIVRYVC